jgi:glycine cleavage system H protein
MSETWFDVEGYRLYTDRFYDPELHLWVELPARAGPARIGFDPLGRETRGDVVEISLIEPGSTVQRGQPFGSLEAAKFVGPLEAPLSGTVAAVNPDVIASPGRLNQGSDETWLIEIEPADRAELEQLLQGEERVRPWFAAEVERYRRQGAVAE